MVWSRAIDRNSCGHAPAQRASLYALASDEKELSLVAKITLVVSSCGGRKTGIPKTPYLYKSAGTSADTRAGTSADTSAGTRKVPIG
jgi:hypothetical protein